MNGLVIWTHSDCRSMMGVYRAIIEQLDTHVVMASWSIQDGENKISSRRRLGFNRDEFSDIELIPVGENWEKGKELIETYPGYHHLFGVYQNAPTFRRLIIEAHAQGGRVGILSEAPCVMTSGLLGKIKKWLYLPLIVKNRIRKVVQATDFIANLSGDSSVSMRSIGWPLEKIVPFGYFPPPLIGSKKCTRDYDYNFNILVTGIMAWHRGPDVVIRALILLKKWGIRCRAIFTQTGPLFAKLQQQAIRYELEVSFVGFLPLAELTQLYETCSLFVAAGRSEPWGMRLNDALQCGMPIAVSRGMGGVQMVDEYGCGFSFEADDELDLASKLRAVIQNKNKYLEYVRQAQCAAKLISPERKTKEFIETVNARFNRWFE